MLVALHQSFSLPPYSSTIQKRPESSLGLTVQRTMPQVFRPGSKKLPAFPAVVRALNAFVGKKEIKNSDNQYLYFRGVSYNRLLHNSNLSFRRRRNLRVDASFFGITILLLAILL